MSRKSLAEFELLVTLAVQRLGETAYGGSILREISARTGRDVSIGALYATLARLQQKGLVTLTEAEPEVGQRGRPRKYCRLTADGLEATRASAKMLTRMLEGVTFPETIR
jgi:PadR family transcriptional regulator PadR